MFNATKLKIVEPPSVPNITLEIWLSKSNQTQNKTTRTVQTELIWAGLNYNGASFYKINYIQT